MLLLILMILFLSFYIAFTDGVQDISATVDYLHDRYITGRFSSTEDDWCPYQPKHYTTLALIHNRGKPPDVVVISVVQELAVAGNVATNSASQTLRNNRIYSRVTKNISDIFAPVTTPDGSTRDPNMILIEGAPGIGKTVLAKEIAFQWSKNKLLATKQLLFLLYLREFNVNSIATIENFVQYMVKTTKIVHSLSKYLFQTKGKDVAIVLDGYDEMSDVGRKKSFIADIIHRKVLSQCCIVITSRPTASSRLHSLVDCRVEIVGFTEEDRLNFIQTALEGKDDQVKALQQYLQSNSTINALCYIPLNMTILLCLAEDGINGLPKTQTDLYEKFIKLTIRRFIQKINDGEDSIKISSITELPSPHNEVFKELAHLAFDALQTDKIVFTLAEIESFCPNLTVRQVNRDGLGLLKVVPYFDRETGNEDATLHFLHFSIQEYMAAYYISMLSNAKQIKLLKDTFWEQRYYNTWIMYVGITGASSFALKHFLSGNRIQLITKLSSTLSVSTRLLNDKVKCLHLFQCLVESKRIPALVGKGQEIDLSNQTLLPSDLNTLAFFLCRSVTKHWQILNLSGCSIGVTGCDILCNRFSETENHDIVSVKLVDLSYNHLTFSCLFKLFGIFKSWHTSEVIITEDVMLNNITSSSLFAAVEENFNIEYTLNLLLVGTFLYLNNVEEGTILCVLSRIRNIQSLYLMHCVWDSRVSEFQQWCTALRQHRLDIIHVVGTDISNSFIEALTSLLSSCDKPSELFIFDPFLSDGAADGLRDIPVSSDCVRIVISRTRVQGVAITRLLSDHLSSLELLNLSTCIRNCDQLQSPVWIQKVQKHGDKSQLVSIPFLLQHVLCQKACHCQLQLVLSENEIIFALKTNAEQIFNVINPINNFAYVVNSNVNKGDVRLLHREIFEKGCDLQELFIHGAINVGANDLVKLIRRDWHNTSSLVVYTSGIMIGHNPTAKQIALAFQLEPSITVWKLLPSTQVTADVFYQLTSWLTTNSNNWTELNFEGCNITDALCEMIHKQIILNGCCSTVKIVNVPGNQLTIAVIPTLIEIIFIWKVQQCTIKGVGNCFSKLFINGLTKRKILKTFASSDKIKAMLVTHSYISYLYYGIDLNEIRITDDQIREVYIVKCHIKAYSQVLYCLSRNFITAELEVSIYDAVIIDCDTFSTYNILHGASVKFALLTTNCIYEFNATQHQLQFVHHIMTWRCNSTEYSIGEMSENLFMPQSEPLEAVYFIGKQHPVMHASQISIVLCGITVLKRIMIENYYITDEDADDIVAILSHIITLKEIYLNYNYLHSTAATKIMKCLQCMPELQVLCFNENHAVPEKKVVHNLQANEMNNIQLTIADAERIGNTVYNCKHLKVLRISDSNGCTEMAKFIVRILNTAVHLQELDVSKNNLQTTDLSLLCKAMQELPELTKLFLSQNKITDSDVDDITTVLSKNTQLEEFDLSYNKLTSAGAVKIVDAMKKFRNLRVLRMAYSNINSTAAKSIADFLSYNVRLQELDLRGNNLQATGCTIICKAIQQISKLNKLVLSNNNITDEATQDITLFINSSPQLKEVHIDQNYFQTESIIKIAAAFKTISTLIKLCMGNNNIYNKAVDFIADILSCNTQLQELKLQISNLLPDDCIKISEALSYTSTLLKLAIINGNITSESADSIAAVLFHSTQLRELILDGNYLQAAGINKVLRGLRNTSTLVKLSIQDNHCTEDAAHDIADVISHNTGLQELNLQGNDLQTGGIVVIAKALQKISTLIELNIGNDIITNEAADDVAGFLSKNSLLQKLNFSNLTVESTEKILSASKLLRYLKVVRMVNCDISNTAAEMLAGIISINIQLEELDLNESNIQARGCLLICSVQKVTTLRKLNLSGSNITDEATDGITNLLLQNAQLQILDLSQNNFDEASTIKIIEALLNVNLKVLRLANGTVTSTVGEVIAEILYHNVQLLELDLNGNNLKSAGCSAICRAFQGMSLTKLSLMSNSITYEAVDDIADLLSHNIQLQELQLQISNLTAIDCIKISCALRFTSSLLKLSIVNSNITSESADSMAAVLSHNTQLQELNLYGNYLELIGIKTVLKSLKNTATLVKLSIQDNCCTDDAAHDIADVISHNTGLQELNLRGNDLKTAGIKVIRKSFQSSSIEVIVEDFDITVSHSIRM